MGITSGTVGVVFAATLIGCGVHGSTGSKAVFSGRFSGPEGGFTEGEVERARSRGAITVTLGKRILRSETAAIVAAALLLHLNGEI